MNSQKKIIAVSHSPSEESQAMRELRDIARRVGVKFDENNNPINPPGMNLKSIAPNVSLKPFHLHLKFSSEEEIKAFEKWIESLGAEETFKTPSLLVFSVDLQNILALLEEIKNKKIQTSDPLPSLSSIPLFHGFSRISFYFDRMFQPEGTFLLFQHWDLHFLLPNRFELLDKLKSRKVKMLYEAPELWVFETEAENLKEVVRLVRETGGLKPENIKLSLLPDSGKIRVRISVYLSGR